jgi:hypothetical protein
MQELIRSIDDWQNKSAKEIADIVNANPHTLTDIEITSLLFLLNERGMLVRLLRPTDTGEKWGGSLVNLILGVNQVGTAQQIEMVNRFFSHITNERNRIFSTTNPLYAGQILFLKAAFAGKPNMPTAADFDAVLALGRGIFAVTIEQVETVLESMKLEEKQQALRSEFASTYNSAIAVVDAWDGSGDKPRLVLFDGEN